MKTQSIIAVITLLILSASPALAGWKAVDKEGAITLVSNGKFKHVSPEDGMITLFDSAKGTITMVNDREKVYTTGKPQDFCKGMKEMMDSAKKQMDEAMANVPPEQRAMMEEMMKQSMPTPSTAPAAKPSVSIKKAGSGGKVAGWDTDKYQVMVDGKLYEEVWLVSDSAIKKDIAKVDFSAFQEFSSCTRDQHGGGQDPEDTPEYMELVKKGWEVKSVSHGTVEQHSSDTVSLEKKDIPESEFSVSPGYRKVGMMEIFSMEPEEEY
jgi:hypothetical protein